VCLDQRPLDVLPIMKSKTSPIAGLTSRSLCNQCFLRDSAGLMDRLLGEDVLSRMG
jgi:hypothetical protein